MITKSDAAMQQFNTAVDLYFRSDSMESIHTLAAASFTLTEDILKGGDYEKFTLTSSAKAHIPSKYHNHFIRLFRKQQNYLKHADNDKDEQHLMNPRQTELMLFYVALLSTALMAETNRSISWVKYPSIPAYIFWFMFNNKDLFKNSTETSLDFEIQKLFPDFPAPLTNRKRQEYYQWCQNNIPALLQRVFEQSIEPFFSIAYSSITVFNELTDPGKK